MTTITTAVFLAACCVLIYTGFSRLLRTNVSTAFCIRIIFWSLPAAAMLSILAVVAYGHEPAWTDAMLVSGMASAQWVTLLLWRDGVPAPYWDGINRARQSR